MTARIGGQPHALQDVEHMQDYLINWNAGPLGVVLRPDLGADMPPVVAQLLPQPSVLKLAGVREGDLLISVNGKKTTRLGYEKVVRLLFQERLPMVLHFRSPLGASRAVIDEPIRTRTSSCVCPPTYPSRPRGRSDVIESQRNPTIDSSSSCAPHQSKKTKSKHKKCSAKEEADEKRLRKQYSVVWERGSLGLSFRAYNSKVNVPCVDFISANRGQGRGMDFVCVNDVLIAINGEKTKALGVEKVLRWLHVIEKPVVLRFHASSNRVVLDSVGRLIPPYLAEKEEMVGRPKRVTLPHAQPEFEPVPRPPRRNNSVDILMQKRERRYLDTKENDCQPTMLRHYSRVMSIEKQPQSNENYESSLHQFGARSGRGRGQSYETIGAEDSRHEPMTADALHVDPRSDEHVIPRRRQEHEDTTCFSQQNQTQPIPVRTRASSALRDNDLRRQQQQQQSETKSGQLPDMAPVRPRVDSRESQGSNTSQLSFDEAADVVARASGKPVEECKFGGIPVLNIKEGTVQSKLMYIYAKACLAKKGSLDDNAASMEPPPARTTGNPFGRKTGSQYLSYTILQDDAAATAHVASSEDGCVSCASVTELEKEHKVDVFDNSIESKNAGASDHMLDESLATMEKDISIQSVATPPLNSTGVSFSVSSDAASNAFPPIAPVAGDFISLKDFVVKGGNLIKRCTTQSLSSTAAPVQTKGGGESATVQDYEKNRSASNNTDKNEAIVETTSDASSKSVGGETELAELKKASCGDSRQAEPVIDEKDQTGNYDKMVVQEVECSNKNEHKQPDEYEDAKVENAHEDDDVSGNNSSNEHNLAASVASLDSLLNLPVINDNYSKEECEEFGDGNEEINAKISSDDKQSRRTSLDMKSCLVQEKKVGETDDYEAQRRYDEHRHDEENEGHDEKEEIEDGALSSPLVNELYSDKPDVCKVIMNRPVHVVLVKKSMINEVQEILQSLQTELQFERHSTVAVGSIASPLCMSQQDWETEDEHCYQCGATGELAKLNVASGQNGLYCEKCWELFFSEDRKSTVLRPSKTLTPPDVGRLTADEDALDEALKYSFHDSTITREDMIRPWQHPQGNDSMSSSLHDSNASSLTDHADEIWL